MEIGKAQYVKFQVKKFNRFKIEKFSKKKNVNPSNTGSNFLLCFWFSNKSYFCCKDPVFGLVSLGPLCPIEIVHV